MFLESKVIKVITSMYFSGERSYTSPDSAFQVKLVILDGEVASHVSEIFVSDLDELAGGRAAFASMSVVWAGYLFYEARHDLQFFFVIRYFEPGVAPDALGQ